MLGLKQCKIKWYCNLFFDSLTSDKIESELLKMSFQRNSSGVYNYLIKLKL
jgi:hypothetical protein